MEHRDRNCGRQQIYGIGRARHMRRKTGILHSNPPASSARMLAFIGRHSSTTMFGFPLFPPFYPLCI